MAPALNEPLNQAQLPLLPASASSSPRPGIFSSNGADLVQKPNQPQPSHAITNRYNKISHIEAPNNTNTNRNSSNSSSTSTNKSSQNTFQLAFIQQIQSNTATNGPAATGLPNVQRHMDRKDSPSSSRTVKPSSTSSSASSLLQQPASSNSALVIQPNSRPSAAGTVTTNTSTVQLDPQNHSFVHHHQQQQQQHQLDEQSQPPPNSSNDEEENDDDADALKDVQELADLDLQLDEETTNALINHHSLCETLSPTPDQQQQLHPHNNHQHHQQQQQHHQNHQHQQLAGGAATVAAQSSSAVVHSASSPSHNNNTTMGLQKDYLKDNPDMEQMLGELANTSDLELLQVFKSLTPSSSDNLCDLASGLGGLFNDVDVMNISLDEVSTPVKEPDTVDLRNEIKKRQSQMQRKCDFLLRRLRKLQARTMADHVDEEVLGMFAYARDLLKGSSSSDGTGLMSYAATISGSVDGDFDDYHLIGDYNDHTRAMQLLQRLDKAADGQQKQLQSRSSSSAIQQAAQHHHTQPLQQRKSKDHTNAAQQSSAGAVATASLPSTMAQSPRRVISCFEPAFSSQMALTAGHLYTEIKLIGSALDSDATVSSSGGDSGDEFSAHSKQQQPNAQHLYQQQQPNQSSKEIPNIQSEKIWCFNGERMVRKYKTKKIKRQEFLRAQRAAARWSRDRATIASRWSWLLAQVSDLEYRIRQHGELHQQIKKSKGAVTFEDGMAVAPPSQHVLAAMSSPDATLNGYRGLLPGNNTTTAHHSSGASKASSATDAMAAAAASTTSSAINNNGAFGNVAAATAFVSGVNCSSSSSNVPGACRTRAFQRAEFRKRKLLQTTNLHTISKKAAKQSTVKCGCQWPLYPCALCTGRPDPTAPRDLPDMLSSSERVGLLDAGFHPVISFTSDVAQGIHIEASLRNIEFQTKACRASTKAAMRNSLALQKAQKKEDRSNRKLFGSNASASGSISSSTGKKKYNVVANKLKKKSKKNSIGGTSPNSLNASQSSSSTTHNNTPNQQRSHHNNSSNSSHYGSTGKHKKYSQYQHNHNFSTPTDSAAAGAKTPGAQSFGGSSGGVGQMTASQQQHHSEHFEYGPNGAMLPRSKNASPTHQHGGKPQQRSGGGTFYASASSNDRRGGARSSAYDIDNIVIPYSVAATTRVEILQCKEIPTPKWRTLADSSDGQKSMPTTTAAIPSVTEATATASVPASSSSAAATAAASATTASSPAAMPCIVSKDRVIAAVVVDDELEDVSSDAILRRHESALAEERKKFATYLKFPWSTRSRANRRIDSRADSSGANTPDPTSPALPKTPGTSVEPEFSGTPTSHNQQHPPTAVAGGTTLEQIAENAETPAASSNGGRRRTVSTKRNSASDDRNSNDLRDMVQPYEHREFPLSDEAFASLLEQMPSAHHELIDKAIQQHQLQQQQQQQQHQQYQQQALRLQQQQHHQQQNAGPSSQQYRGPSFGNDLPAISPVCHSSLLARFLGPISDVDGNPYGYALPGLRDTDEETESIESGMIAEDPNDPEWFEPS